MKKKPIGYLKPLLLLLFMLLYANLYTTLAYDIFDKPYDLTGKNLRDFYTILRDNSTWYASQNDTSYYNSIITRWASGDEIMNLFSDNDLDIIAEDLNSWLEQVFITSGDQFQLCGYNTTTMSDGNMWVMCLPATAYNNTSPQIIYLFIPKSAFLLKGLEQRNSASGEYIYKTQWYSYKYNMSGDAITTTTSQQFAGLILKTDGTYSFNTTINGNNYSNALASVLNGTNNFYRRDLPTPFDGIKLYYIGLLSTYRGTKPTWADLEYKGYTFYDYKSMYNDYYYNLGTNTVISGDEQPTPTPTGSGEGGITINGGMTQEEFIGGLNEYWGTSGDLNGEKQEEEISNAVNEIMDNISGDFSNNAIVKTLESGEAGFLSFFESGHDENWYDLKFNWPDIDLDYKWNNQDVNGLYFISGDSINISAMCREIPILGTIQTLIRTIFNFSICMMLVKQIWNLLLATLGIDNPYLYENPDEEDISFSINENAGTITKTVRKGKITRRKTI